MLLQTGSLILSFTLLIQTGSVIPAPVLECLTPGEQGLLSKEKNLDNRIKVYVTVSTRFEDLVQTAVAKQDLEAVSVKLKCWLEILDWSLKDIGESMGPKKAPKTLIRLEIQLRKAILNITENKAIAPEETAETFNSWVTRAEEIHKRFVDMLFQK